MSTKPERRAARDAVTAYHRAQLALLVDRVSAEIDRYRAGELDVFDVDHVFFQYSRAAKELWKFCNLADVETTANIIREYPPADWWQRGAPRKR